MKRLTDFKLFITTVREWLVALVCSLLLIVFVGGALGSLAGRAFGAEHSTTLAPTD